MHAVNIGQCCHIKMNHYIIIYSYIFAHAQAAYILYEYNYYKILCHTVHVLATS